MLRNQQIKFLGEISVWNLILARHRLRRPESRTPPPALPLSVVRQSKACRSGVRYDLILIFIFSNCAAPRGRRIYTRRIALHEQFCQNHTKQGIESVCPACQLGVVQRPSAELRNVTRTIPCQCT
ncbi:hypothetical protein RSAG8_06925, partial [Rhizoctonia solani AG-8 WAC10335]